MPPLLPYRDGAPDPAALREAMGPGSAPPVPPLAGTGVMARSGGPAPAPPPDRPVSGPVRGETARRGAPEDPALSLFADRAREMATAAAGARAMLARPLDAFLWWPWRALHDLTNTIPPEELWIIAGMSGSGKTTLLMSLLDAWLESGLSVMYVGLEMPPRVLVLHLACRRLVLRGVLLHPGDVLKGKLTPGHPNELPGSTVLRQELLAEVDYIQRELAERCRFVPVAWLTAANAARICEQAAAWGVQAIIVDHLDHLDADGQPMSDYAAHAQVLKVLHAACKQFGVTILGAGQMNTDALKKPGALVRSYTRPGTEMVQYGMLKRRICDVLMIVHKLLPPVPERADDIDAYQQAMRLVREDTAMIDRYLVPNTMGVTLDKDRAYGHDGRQATLGVYNSRIVDANPEDLDVATRRLLTLAKPKSVAAAPAPRALAAGHGGARPPRRSVTPIHDAPLDLHGLYD